MSLFITFEGPEGCGKSTQARLLYEWLQKRGYPVILTREPGGTRIGDLIRRILLDLQHTEMAPPTETLLFSAARAQLVNEVIRPYLGVGGIVVCDRYVDSTYAHQGYGLGHDLAELRAITAVATGGLLPDLTLFLDLSAEEGLERKRASMRERAAQPASPALTSGLPPPRARPEWNRLDARDLAYHQQVARGYRQLIEQEPERWHTYNARGSIDTLAREIRDTVEPLLERVRPLEAAG
ncbi:MAG: dTMP kinase [Chloroflexales bacterium]|nr:dTMP kinase [Chloroflexales bacterium]